MDCPCPAGITPMTSRRNIEDHRRSVDEIHDIMNSMKMLAYMQAQKLDRLLETQHAMVSGIEAVASDFVSSYPKALPDTRPSHEVYLLIGSERGFCGDYNQALLRNLEKIAKHSSDDSTPTLILIGQKLHPLLEHEVAIAERLVGASVVEEVETVLDRIVDVLAALQARYGTLALSALYHAGNDGGFIDRILLPPFLAFLDEPEQFPTPPLLNLAPADFLIELSDQYLYAALHEIFYTALLAENQQRIHHLDGAIKHLDDESQKLRRQANARRQEEIIEEIEVILLSAASLKTPLPKQ